MRRHHKIWIEAILWVVAEIILSSSGLDTLADYNEFLINQKTDTTTQVTQTITRARTTTHAIGLT